MENEKRSGNLTRVIVIIIAVLVIGGLIYAFTGNNEDGGNQTDNQTQNNVQNEGEVKVFNVTGRPFSFTPTEIRVKQGDRVRIVFANENGLHDWVLDEFNVRTPQIQTGQTAQVEFTVNKTGTFEYYCSVGNHRQMGMRGNLVVE